MEAKLPLMLKLRFSTPKTAAPRSHLVGKGLGWEQEGSHRGLPLPHAGRAGWEANYACTGFTLTRRRWRGPSNCT
jgi:hypothetical protein